MKVLLVEDSADDAALIERELRRRWCDVVCERVEDVAAMRAELAKGGCDVVLCDWSMPSFSASSALGLVRDMGIDVPFILISGKVGEDVAVEAMRSGAHDYILKGKLARLNAAVAREVADRLHREEMRAAENALKAQEHRFRSLIEKSRDGIFLTAADGAVSYLSPAGKRIFGLENAAPGSYSPVDLWHPEDRARVEAVRRGLLSDPGGSVTAEYRIVRPSGAVRWIELTATNMLADPDVGAIVGNFRDITEERKSLDDIRASEKRFRALADSGIVGIAISTNAGAYIEANDAFLAMVGYTRDDLAAGKVRWADMTPPELQAQNVDIIRQLRAHGFVPTWEKEYLRKDGSRVPCLLGVSGIDATYNVVFAVDLTEQKRMEAALGQVENQFRHAQKMEAVGRLAGGVAHDFNNALSVILSYATLIQETLPPDDPLREDASEITKAGRRAADLTRQLLTFSRQQVVETEILDVNALLVDMDKMLRRLVGEDIELVSALAMAPGTVRADPGSLEQVIMNLVVNARDAMPTGGKLTIATANVSLDADYARMHVGVTPGPHVMLSVTDTGVGMDEATKARIFDPFFTTKGSGKGTGLGLSTVFGIVQQSGGTVWVESAPGEGASFNVFLPRADEPVTHESRPPEPTSLRGTETILLVEDEDPLRLVARTILVRFGYRVLEARSGTEALALCEQHPAKIHLLLSDVVMPKMSGPDLAKRLSALHPEMRVLLMSGYTDDSSARHGLIEDQMAFLPKPFTPATLTRRVREVLDSTME